MAILDDCSPPEALDLYHQRAIDEVVAQLNAVVASMEAQSATMLSVLDGLDDTLDSLLSSTGVSSDDIRDSACSLPRNPTNTDIESQLDATAGLRLILGRIVLNGDLDISALKRLYSIFKSVPVIYGLIPELSAVAEDPIYGVPEVPTRLLVISLEKLQVETTPSLCAPDDIVVTENEIVVSINEKIPEDSDDRVVVCIWIGDVTVDSVFYGQLQELGFTIEEIRDLLLKRTTDALEVYQIKDPVRLGKYLGTLESDEDDAFLVELLQRGPDLIRDVTTITDITTTINEAISSPPVSGCGIHPAVAMLATVDVNSLYPTGLSSGDRSANCEDTNVFAEVNSIFGSMGVMEKAIAKVMARFQSTAGTIIARLSDTISLAERTFLPSAEVGFNAGSLGSYGVSLQGSASAIPGVPSAPVLPTVSIASMEQFQGQLEANVGVITDFVNLTTQVSLGMSLLACTLSQFGSTVGTLNLPVAGAPSLSLNMSECSQNSLDAHIDLSALTFDWLNAAISQLNDTLHRLRALIEQLRQAQSGPEALFRLQCSITETAQLAVSLARRLTAANFGRF